MASLGIECGATHSIGVLQWGTEEMRLEIPPANYQLLSGLKLQQFFQKVKSLVEDALPPKVVVRGLGIGMPGIVTDDHRNKAKKSILNYFQHLKKLWVGSDLETAFKVLEQTSSPHENLNCLVLAGSGSACCAQVKSPENQDVMVITKIGGNGHIVGDRGSGYDIGLNGLRAAFREFEYTGNSSLLALIKAALNIETNVELVSWSVTATKREIASVAKTVIQHWTASKDKVATVIVQEAARDLAGDFFHLIQRIDPPRERKLVLGFTGSLLTENADFSQLVKDKLREYFKDENPLTIQILHEKMTVSGSLLFLKEGDVRIKEEVEQDLKTRNGPVTETEFRKIVLPTFTDMSPTERRNPASKTLDTMIALEGIELMLNEEKKIYDEIRKEKGKIAQLILKITKAFQNGGRLFYVGAGTSGRLGILDASECPPTFKAPPNWVQGLLSGGPSAMFRSVEGAEDSSVTGALTVKERGVNEKDVVIGIAASGRTPFVWGALHEAIKSKATTAFLTFNPNLDLKLPVDILLSFDVGPEVLTGSTRLKCGTATKSILNMLTTLSMVKYGKCLENLMVDLSPSNEKLKERAARIVITILGEDHPELDKDEAIRVLEENNYDIKKVVRIFRGKFEAMRYS